MISEKRDSAIEPIEAVQRELVHRICATPAATTAGIQAKARGLVTWAPDRMKGCVCIDGLLLASLLASLLADLTRETSAVIMTDPQDTASARSATWRGG